MISETDTPDLVTEVEDDDGESGGVHVSAGIHTLDGEALHVHAIIDPDSTPEQVAAMLLRVASSVASLHSSETWMALQHRVVGPTP